MSSLINALNETASNVYFYAGLIELLTGIVGNMLTIVAFSQAPLRAGRTALCLVVLAVLNMAYLMYGLLPVILIGKWHQSDITFGSDVLCHFRFIVAYTLTTSIVSLLAWIAFDRYTNSVLNFISRHSVSLCC